MVSFDLTSLGALARSFPSTFSLPRRGTLLLMLLLARFCHQLTGVVGFHVTAPPNLSSPSGRPLVGPAHYYDAPAHPPDVRARTPRHWWNVDRGRSPRAHQGQHRLFMTLDKLSDVQEETLLCVQMQWNPVADLDPLNTEALLLNYVRSFPFAAVLPVQPLTYLPTTRGVDVTFLRKKTPTKPTHEGGIRFVLEPVADEASEASGAGSASTTTAAAATSWVLTARRNSEGQSVQKLFSEKLIVQEFLAGLTGASQRFAATPTTTGASPGGGGGGGHEEDVPLLPRDVVQVTSVYHKWMSERR